MNFNHNIKSVNSSEIGPISVKYVFLLLNKFTVFWFDENCFSIKVFSHCTIKNDELINSQQKNVSSNQLFSVFKSYLCKCVTFTKFLPKRCSMIKWILPQCGNFGNFPPLQKFFVKLMYSITLLWKNWFDEIFAKNHGGKILNLHTVYVVCFWISCKLISRKKTNLKTFLPFYVSALQKYYYLLTQGRFRSKIDLGRVGLVLGRSRSVGSKKIDRLRTLDINNKVPN